MQNSTIKLQLLHASHFLSQIQDPDWSTENLGAMDTLVHLHSSATDVTRLSGCACFVFSGFFFFCIIFHIFSCEEQQPLTVGASEVRFSTLVLWLALVALASGLPFTAYPSVGAKIL